MDLGSYATVAASTTAAVWASFAAAHKVTNAEFNRSLGSTLKDSDVAEWLRTLPSRVSNLFDLVFTTRPFSRSFVLRSFAASMITYGILWLIFFSAADLGIREYLDTFPTPLSLVLVILVMLFGNLAPDYVSLLETRFLIRRAAQGKPVTLTRVAMLLAVDFVATLIIFVIVYAPVEYLLYIPRDGAAPGELMRSFQGNMVVVLEYFRQPHIDVQSNIWFENLIQFCTTFVTSVWLWLFCTATLSVRLAGSLGGPIWRWLRDRLLDLENRPVLSLGFVSAGIAAAGFLVLAPFVVN